MTDCEGGETDCKATCRYVHVICAVQPRECRHLFRHGATRLPSACCFLVRGVYVVLVPGLLPTQLRDKIWQWPRDESRYLSTSHDHSKYCTNIVPVLNSPELGEQAIYFMTKTHKSRRLEQKRVTPTRSPQSSQKF